MLLELSPYAFKIGPIAVHWYGIFMAISFLVGFYYIYIMSQKTGLDEDFILNLVMMVIISGIIGARLMFVLTNYPSWFVSEPLQVLRFGKEVLPGMVGYWEDFLLAGLIVERTV